MANNSKTPTFSFKTGETIHVFETKGCRELKGGVSSSERKGGEYPDLEPSEDLVVVKTLGSNRAVVRREDGMEILVHANHFNAESAYYGTRGKKSASQPQTTKKPVETLAAKKAEIEKLMKEMQELAAKLASAEEVKADEATEIADMEIEFEDESKVSQEARDEARALFDEVA